MALQIDGQSLDIHHVEKVARHGETLTLSDAARQAVLASEATVRKLVDSGAAIYGVTTGIGEFARIRVSPEQGEELQRRIIFSHAAGTGDPQPVPVVRAAMTARANTLSKGYSGVRLSTLDTYIEMLNRGVIPVVYEKGSLGVSGDLSPLSQLALVVIGAGEAFFEGQRMPGAQALSKAGLEPVRLTFKEGLGLINGTQMMAGEAALQLCDTQRLYQHALLSYAMSLEALKAVGQPFDPRVHRLKPQEGQAHTAEQLRLLWEGSEILADPTGRVQDGYSIRCTPQIMGPSWRALRNAIEVVETELNAAADNPLFFSDTGECLAAANFHGQGIAMAMDFMAIATTEIGSLAERHTNRLLNPILSGLPDFLIDGKGLNSGMMVAQYTQAALLAENRVLSHPAVVDNVSVSADQEDHVCMGSVCIRKYKEVLRNTEAIVAIQLLCAAQALDFRLQGIGMGAAAAAARPCKLGKGTGAAYEIIRREVPFMAEDRPLVYDIEKIAALVRGGELLSIFAA